MFASHVLFIHSYLIAESICYLILCEASFSKKSAFAYLEDLHNEFYDQHWRRVHQVTRPYSFIEFGENYHHKILKQNNCNFRKIVISKPVFCRHIHSENKERLCGQPSQEESEQHQHRATGCSENNGS